MNRLEYPTRPVFMRDPAFTIRTREDDARVHFWRAMAITWIVIAILGWASAYQQWKIHQPIYVPPGSYHFDLDGPPIPAPSTISWNWIQT